MTDPYTGWDASRIDSIIDSSTLFSWGRVLTDTSSTNDEALAMIESGVVGNGVVVADFQTNGRGQMGRQWAASRGKHLLMSAILSPTCSADRWSGISLIVGMALVDTLNHWVPLATAIHVKWPNDILLNHKKCAGILIEAKPASGKLVVGIGLNVNECLDHEDRTSIRMVRGEDVDRYRVFESLIHQLDVHANNIDHGRIPTSELMARLAFLNLEVQLTVNHQSVTGRLLGIHHDGALVIDTNEGIRHVVSGTGLRPLVRV